jgi:SH3 domain-containing YSC84-like protein 1
MSPYQVRQVPRPSKLLRQLTGLLLIAGSTLPLVACSRSSDRASVSAPTARNASAQQAIVEESAAALQKMRSSPRFARADFILEQARGVLIFPQLVKASLIVGGEGGSGVLVARKPDGTWSDPAFYSVGAPSLGLQLGYQRATVVLFIMDERTLERTMNASLTLGTKAGATLGYVDENGNTKANVVSANIYQLVDADGMFVGVSLDGYVMSTRQRHNREYYGRPITPREILLNGASHKAEASILERALAPRPEPELAPVSVR